jgi:glycosyltransferase involved in cell wall biosynthesis
MIVKDAEDTIRETLLAIKPYIERWTILDTGSTDRTLEIIRNTLDESNGTLYTEPFIDFATSRNRALELAGTSCKYTIMLDDSYVLRNGEALRQFLQTSETSPSFDIPILDNKNRLYYSKRILLSKLKLKYKYPVHEIVEECDGIVIDYAETKIHLFDYRDWQAELRTASRYPEYISILTRELEKNPNDSRLVYFLANTYYEMRNYEKANEFYEKRSRLEPLKSEEVYLSWYMLGVIAERMNRPAVPYYKQAYEIDNERAEPLFAISVIYYRDKKYERAYEMLRNASQFRIPRRLCQVEYQTYLEEIPTLLAEVCLLLDKTEEARVITESTFRINPNSYRLKNLLVYFEEKNRKTLATKDSRKLYVFHTGTHWNPDTHEFASGSELTAQRIAEELVRRNCRVFIFLKEGKKQVIDGVEYRDVLDYESFLKTQYIDVLVVLRFVENLRYFETIQRVYLWLHDLLPQGNSFHTHKTKFCGVICPSEWHKSFFCKEYGFPESAVKVIGNCINLNLFVPSEKIPLRFIYTSDPKRGLKNAYSLFQKFRKRYSYATLHVFGNTPNLNLPNVFIHPRLSQKELAKEFGKSDVWLYPTNWRETFCISALEAQATRTLCVAYSVGALSETIGVRGVLAETEDALLNKLFKTIELKMIKDTLLDRGQLWSRQFSVEKIGNSWFGL